MKKYAIITDSAADLTRAERERLGLWPEIMPLAVYLKDRPVPNEELSDLTTFYARMSSGEILPGELKTASVNLEDAIRLLLAMDSELPSDVAIVYAGITDELSSGTTQAVLLAMQECREVRPGREFIFCPTYSISNGQALTLQYLAKYTGDDIVGYAEQIGRRMVHLFTIEDLSFATRSGRFSFRNMAGFIMNKTLRLSPWMYFPWDDRLQASSPFLRPHQLVQRWANYYQAYADADAIARIGYAGGEEAKIARKLGKALQGVGVPEVQLARIGPVIASHTGSSCISVFFLQREERDMAWHKRHYAN